jgi:hypothetical protein
MNGPINPGRVLFQRAYDDMVPHLPALFAMTVLGPSRDSDPAPTPATSAAASPNPPPTAPNTTANNTPTTTTTPSSDMRLVTRGLFVGDTLECFEAACRLSLEVNVQYVSEPQQKVVCFLDPSEYKSMWVANKAIYRTRLAVADGGELLVLAPGVRCFSSKPVIDGLIRRHGYATTYVRPSVRPSVRL